jgi:hypothetical protein
MEAFIMTRQDIEKEYKINSHGIIENPGKFEGCMLFVPYFYDIVMNGGQDDTVYIDDVPEDIIYITKEDIAIFPELEGKKEIHLATDNDGFIHYFLTRTV